MGRRNVRNTYIRHCKECNKIFKPKSKYNYYCLKCLKKRKNARWILDYEHRLRKKKNENKT